MSYPTAPIETTVPATGIASARFLAIEPFSAFSTLKTRPAPDSPTPGPSCLYAEIPPEITPPTICTDLTAVASRGSLRVHPVRLVPNSPLWTAMRKKALKVSRYLGLLFPNQFSDDSQFARTHNDHCGKQECTPCSYEPFESRPGEQQQSDK